MIVNVWDWKNGVKVASNKFSSKVKAVSFAENGSYFVTVGNRHVKFWYLDVARGSKFKEPVPLTGRSAILGEQRNNYFCDVACGRGEMGDSTFAITKSGLLCEFNNRRLLDKWVELRTTSANCLVAGEHFIFVGCGDAIVRCFNPFNLQFITTLPRTHYLGVDVSKGLTIKHMGQHPPSARYPDTVAVAYDPNNHKLTAVYNDHSLYVWDVTDIKRVGKSHSYLYHSACIWGVESYPSAAGGSGGGLRPSQRGSAGLLPEGSFITCSSDDTIRVWNIAPDLPPHPLYKRNIYSNDLLRALYVDPDLSYLKDTDISPSGGQDKQQQQGGGSGGAGDASYDSRNGVRCIKISPDGRHIASGDRAGNIRPSVVDHSSDRDTKQVPVLQEVLSKCLCCRIHELQELEEVCKIEAHDAEVLCLEYTRPDTQHSLLASASRDRLIHVFDVGQDYRFLQTLDDHSSAITSVRFYQGQQGLQMVSCSADRSIIFRSATVTNNNEVAFNRGHNIAGKTTLYDMEVDYGQRHILTACQDRSIRVYSVNSGKQSKSFKGSIGDDGSLIKVVLDPSGIYAATSCTDKNMCIYDYYTAECLATMYGHSELVTGLKFAPDGRHLISVSGDGCIFIWRLPHDMSQTITARLSQQAERATKETRRTSQSTSNLLSPTRPNKLLHGPLASLHRPPSTPALHQPGYGDADPYRPSSAGPFDVDPDTGEPDYRFSIGQLPTWAKKKVSESSEPAGSPTSGNPDLPKGRWAQKVPNSSITFKSHYDTDSVVQFPTSDKGPVESESSKESSLEESGKPLPPPRPRRSSTSGGSVPGQHDTISPSRVNTRRGTEAVHKTSGGPSDVPKRSQFSGDPRRPSPRSHATDDSDGSSLRVDGGGTTTDHDGDVEDCSEQDDVSTEPEPPIYYPHNDDTASEFRVNAMDAEELRRSQRRMRSGGSGGLVAVATLAGKSCNDAVVVGGSVPVGLGLSPAAMSGSQESDEEDEVSTPSGDTAERTMLSALSCESVDKLGRRESFLKSTYESLGSDTRQHDRDNKNSISYRFNARHKDPPAVSNRKEELLKKIEETRKKLQSIGYKSSLRTSKSISDLSNIPEKDNAFMSLGVGPPSSQHTSSTPGTACTHASRHTVSDEEYSRTPDIRTRGRFLIPIPPYLTDPALFEVLQSGCLAAWRAKPKVMFMDDLMSRDAVFAGGQPLLYSQGLAKKKFHARTPRSEYAEQDSQRRPSVLPLSHRSVASHTDFTLDVGGAVFDDCEVAPYHRQQGQFLLMLLEKLLREFEKLVLSADRAEEESMQSVRWDESKKVSLSSHSSRKLPNADSDSDTVRSNDTDYSYDSLEDDEQNDSSSGGGAENDCTYESSEHETKSQRNSLEDGVCDDEERGGDDHVFIPCSNGASSTWLSRSYDSNSIFLGKQQLLCTSSYDERRSADWLFTRSVGVEECLGGISLPSATEHRQSLVPDSNPAPAATRDRERRLQCKSDSGLPESDDSSTELQTPTNPPLLSDCCLSVGPLSSPDVRRVPHPLTSKSLVGGRTSVKMSVAWGGTASRSSSAALLLSSSAKPTPLTSDVLNEPFNAYSEFDFMSRSIDADINCQRISACTATLPSIARIKAASLDTTQPLASQQRLENAFSGAASSGSSPVVPTVTLPLHCDAVPGTAVVSSLELPLTALSNVADHNFGSSDSLRQRPGRAHRVSLTKRAPVAGVLPSKRGDGYSGDSGFSSSTGGGRAADGGGLRRACSLSDLTNACSTPRRVLPNPTTAGGRKTRTPSKAPGRGQQQQVAGSVMRSNSVSRVDQDEGSGRTGPRQTTPASSKMTPRALKRKSSLSQAVSTGDIRSYRGGDSSSEDNSPPDQKSLRNRSYYGDRRPGGGPVRAVSERDLTSDNSSRSAGLRSSANQLRSGPTPRRQVSASDLSRPSSAASTVDLSPDDYSAVAPAFPLDLESIPLTASVVESMCEWAVESCERLRQVWWRVCSESNATSGQPPAPGEEQQQRALKALMLGAAARAQHALVPLTAAHTHVLQAPSVTPAGAGTTTSSGSSGGQASTSSSSSGDKDPRVVAMMQQYTDMLVNMVQQKMAQAQPTPPGPT
ncbi:WD40 repeat [Trinorchestia longiramus]|nr:WD40 repeat [Trinorchestia longiramus]